MTVNSATLCFSSLDLTKASDFFSDIQTYKKIHQCITEQARFHANTPTAIPLAAQKLHSFADSLCIPACSINDSEQLPHSL